MKRLQARETRALEAYFGEQYPVSDLEDGHAARIDGDRTRSLLRELAPEQARILLLAYVEGKSHREIARELELRVARLEDDDHEHIWILHAAAGTALHEHTHTGIKGIAQRLFNF